MTRDAFADAATSTISGKLALTGQPADYRGGTAHLPWVTHAPRVFQAASVPKSLAAAGAAADGVFINYGLDAVSLRVSAGHVARGAESVGRPADDLEVWQIACLDCHLERDVARRTLGAILAFVSSYVIGGGDDLAARGVPAPFVEPLRELRRRYSTRPGDADARLVEELGLFEYLARRLARWGDPEDCLRQALEPPPIQSERSSCSERRSCPRYGASMTRVRSSSAMRSAG